MKKPVAIKRAIRLVLFLIPLAVLGNLIYIIFSSGDSGIDSLVHMPIFWLGVAGFLSLAPWLIAILRLHIWSRFFKLNLTPHNLTEIVLANDVAAAATPTAVGGGYAKLGLLVYHGARPGVAASLMVIGSIEEYFIFAIMVPICWYFSPPLNIDFFNLLFDLFPSLSTIPKLIAGLVVLIALLYAIAQMVPRFQKAVEKTLTRRWWYRKILLPVKRTVSDFLNAFKIISSGGKRYFAINMLLAGVQWGMRYSVFTALAYGFGLQPHPVHFFLLQWLLFTVLNLVPTPGAIGAAEVGFVLVFRGTMPPELLAVAGGAWRFISTYLQIMVAAAILVIMEKPRLKWFKNRRRLDTPQVRIVGEDEAGYAQPASNGKMQASPTKPAKPASHLPLIQSGHKPPSSD